MDNIVAPKYSGPKTSIHQLLYCDSNSGSIEGAPGQYRIKNVVYLDEKCSGFYQLKGDFSSLF